MAALKVIVLLVRFEILIRFFNLFLQSTQIYQNLLSIYLSIYGEFGIKFVISVDMQ